MKRKGKCSYFLKKTLLSKILMVFWEISIDRLGDSSDLEGKGRPSRLRDFFIEWMKQSELTSPHKIFDPFSLLIEPDFFCLTDMKVYRSFCLELCIPNFIFLSVTTWEREGGIEIDTDRQRERRRWRQKDTLTLPFVLLFLFVSFLWVRVWGRAAFCTFFLILFRSLCQHPWHVERKRQR